MPKRRWLVPGQTVIIIYYAPLGFTQEIAIFQNYERIILHGVSHNIPVFLSNKKTINGTECFWVLPEEAPTQEKIDRIQYELISLQYSAIMAAQKLGYKAPIK